MMKVTDEMVSRFLAWPLPKDFGPDGGVTFTPPAGRNSHIAWPIGTNLLTADQAKGMLGHVLGCAGSETRDGDGARFRWWLALWTADTDEAMDVLNGTLNDADTPEKIRAAIDAELRAVAQDHKNAAPQSEGTRDTGLPEAQHGAPADAAISPGRPAAVAAFEGQSDKKYDAWRLYCEAHGRMFGADKPVMLSPVALQELVESLARPNGAPEATAAEIFAAAGVPSPFDKIGADRMAAIIDEMIYAGHLDSRSQLADARLDYGEPFDHEKAARYARSHALPIPAAEMTCLMVAAGYDIEKTHPGCYARFSYFALFQLLSDRFAKSASVEREARELLIEAQSELKIIASYADDPATNVGLRATAQAYQRVIAKISDLLRRTERTAP